MVVVVAVDNSVAVFLYTCIRRNLKAVYPEGRLYIQIRKHVDTTVVLEQYGYLLVVAQQPKFL